MAKRDSNPVLEKNKGLFLALLANFAIFGVTVTIFGATVPKIIRVFGWSYLVTGAILSGSALGYFVSSFISGFLVHRYGPRVVLLTGLLLQALGLAVFGTVGNAIVNLAAVLSLGFGQGATEVVTNVCVARMERPGQSRLMSLMHAAFPVGAITGPVAVGWLLSSGLDWKYVYRAMAFLSVCMAAILSSFSYEALRTEEEKRREPHSAITLIHTPLLLFLCITIFLYVGSEIGVSSWVAEYFVKLFGVGMSAGAYMVSVFWIGILLGRLLVSYAYRGYRQAELLVGLCVLATVALAFSLFLEKKDVVSLGITITGLGYSAIYPLIMAIAGDSFKKGQSIAIGMVSTAGGIGSFSFPFIMAAIANTYGIRTGFRFYLGTTLSMCICGLAVLYFVRKRREAGS